MSKWIGYAVSVNCGEPLGCYQGTILDADGTTITLTKAFRNGFPYPKSQVTLNAADIKDLKIIETKAPTSEQTHSTVAVTKTCKKTTKATVCENLQANPSSSGNQSQQGVSGTKAGSSRNATQQQRSKPIDIQGQRNNRNNNNSGSYGQSGSTPKGRGASGAPGEKARRRNEACFGSAADTPIDRDFDFEGNLALFDKRALWEQMNSQKPDLVRQADDAGKFRHDENREYTSSYVTDEGVCVPSVLTAARRRLWEGLARAGLAEGARVLLARAAADVCVRLVGGGRRLEARNAHQAPTVAVLCGAHRTGACALTAARLLRSHNCNVVCYTHPTASTASGAGGGEELQRELSALSLSGIPVVDRLDRLPTSVDLLLIALYDLHDDSPPEQYRCSPSLSLELVVDRLDRLPTSVDLLLIALYDLHDDSPPEQYRCSPSLSLELVVDRLDRLPTKLVVDRLDRLPTSVDLLLIALYDLHDDSPPEQYRCSPSLSLELVVDRLDRLPTSVDLLLIALYDLHDDSPPEQYRCSPSLSRAGRGPARPTAD
ncbi:scd6-like sm domain-containing protein [Phthorimaea operculella]|nr:scd6-like sm domain-containing protein [Phthorimaea operculella]